MEIKPLLKPGTQSVVVGQFEKWHGRPAREITRKMRVPPQTDPLLDPSNY
jgi:hypothetical protein